MTSRAILCAGGVLAVAAILSACGRGSPGSGSPMTNPAGDIPDNQVYVVYAPPGGLLRLKVPEGWARTRNGTATVFTDKLNSIRIETVPAPRPATIASATAQELPQIQAAARGFVPGRVTTVRRRAGQAVLITYRAAAAPSPATGKTVAHAVERYEFWRAGQEVVLTLSAPVKADNVDPWALVSNSLRWRG